MIVSKNCAAQTIPTDTTVLKYLYKEAASAYYLRIDTTLRAKESKMKDSLLVIKDGQISNRNEALTVCDFELDLKKSELQSTENQLKSKTKEANKFQILAKIFASTTGIFSIYSIFK